MPESRTGQNCSLPKCIRRCIDSICDFSRTVLNLTSHYSCSPVAKVPLNVSEGRRWLRQVWVFVPALPANLRTGFKFQLFVVHLILHTQCGTDMLFLWQVCASTPSGNLFLKTRSHPRCRCLQTEPGSTPVLSAGTKGCLASVMHPWNHLLISIADPRNQPTSTPCQMPISDAPGTLKLISSQSTSWRSISFPPENSRGGRFSTKSVAPERWSLGTMAKYCPSWRRSCRSPSGSPNGTPKCVGNTRRHSRPKGSEGSTTWCCQFHFSEPQSYRSRFPLPNLQKPGDSILKGLNVFLATSLPVCNQNKIWHWKHAGWEQNYTLSARSGFSPTSGFQPWRDKLRRRLSPMPEQVN